LQSAVLFCVVILSEAKDLLLLEAPHVPRQEFSLLGKVTN